MPAWALLVERAAKPGKTRLPRGEGRASKQIGGFPQPSGNRVRLAGRWRCESVESRVTEGRERVPRFAAHPPGGPGEARSWRRDRGWSNQGRSRDLPLRRQPRIVARRLSRVPPMNEATTRER